MNNIVIDASIILRAILEKDEKVHRKISGLKEKLITSPIFLLECTNAIRNYSSDAEAILEALLEIPISTIELSKNDLKHILEMAIENKTTTYDSSYHYLALKYDCRFITFDKKYYEQAKHLEHIELWG